MPLFDDDRRDRLNEAFNRSHKTFKRAFYATTAVTLLSASFAAYSLNKMQDGNDWDLHSKIDDALIEKTMENNPDLNKIQARNLLLDVADENEKQIKNFGLYNTAMMLLMSGAFFHLQRKTKPDNNQEPRP
jgi:hypothetical protein